MVGFVCSLGGLGRCVRGGNMCLSVCLGNKARAREREREMEVIVQLSR